MLSKHIIEEEKQGKVAGQKNVSCGFGLVAIRALVLMTKLQLHYEKYVR